MISIDSVVKQYSPSVRIGSISLDIPAGGITALVGMSRETSPMRTDGEYCLTTESMEITGGPSAK